MSLTALVSPGCTLLGLDSGHQFSRELRAEPEVVAWILADTCRAQIPGTDSRFSDARVQAYREDSGAYRLHFRHQAAGSYRVASNGRLHPSDLHSEGELLLFNPGAFTAAPTASSPGNSGAELLIRIEPHPLGSRIRIDCSEDELLLSAADSARENLRLLESCAEGLSLAAAERWTALATLMSAENRRLEGLQVPVHAQTKAVVKWYLASAYREQGENHRARAEMANCLRLQPGLEAARSMLIDLDQRLNRSPAALRGMQRRIASRPSSLTSYMLESRFRKLQIDEEDFKDKEGSEDLAHRVRSAIEDGDFAAARAWLDRCFANEPASSRVWRLQVELNRATRDYRDSFTTGLAILASEEVGADEILETCLDGLRLGDAVLGLRHLARNWRRVQEARPRKAERVLDRLLAEIEPELATRVLAMERVPELLAPELGALAGKPDVDQGSLRLYAELVELRVRGSGEESGSEITRRPGFQNAPGVAPAK
ncbi:MAG: tetratricopeptide repeat protein [Planctomycetota bacterium]